MIFIHDMSYNYRMIDFKFASKKGLIGFILSSVNFIDYIALELAVEWIWKDIWREMKIEGTTPWLLDKNRLNADKLPIS